MMKDLLKNHTSSSFLIYQNWCFFIENLFSIMLNDMLFFCKLQIYQQIIEMGCSESNVSEDPIPIATENHLKSVFALKVPTLPQKTDRDLNHDELKKIHSETEDNFESFFGQLSEQISGKYVKICNETVEEMMNGKIDFKQAKLHISEKIFLMNVKVLEEMGKMTNYQHHGMFKSFNKAQTEIIKYLKIKYPQNSTTFAPDDLAKHFQQFKKVNNPRNDILRNQGICFNDQVEKNITNELKKMFNKLIDNLDEHFGRFEKLLQEKVFKIEIETEAQHDEDFSRQKTKYKKLNSKIGRKIPLNISKYNQNDEEQFTITSTEILRVIIKWVRQLQKLVTSSEKQIDSQASFKIYSFSNGKLQFDDLPPEEAEGLLEGLKKSLSSIRFDYEKEKEKLWKEMNQSYMNMLKILSTAERNEKFISEEQTKVIKYAKYNTEFVSWFLIRKLVYLLKNLIRIGKSFKRKLNQIWTLDLIKYNITDLMRAQVSGNKKEILVVFKKMLELEAKKQIKIVEIENKFGTLLNCGVVLFKIKGCSLICELQLILVEGQTSSNKVKCVDYLNHILYELERSPYGILSQLATILSYTDKKVKYENKITFSVKEKINFELCKVNHPDDFLHFNEVDKPFLCNNCINFYRPFESVLGYQYCKKCKFQICCKCMYEGKSSVLEDYIQKRFHNTLLNNISHRNIKQSSINAIKSLFSKKKYFLTTRTKKNFNQITKRDLQSIVKKQARNYLLHFDDIYGAYLLLITFKGGATNIQQYFWNAQTEQLELALKKTQVQQRKINCTSYYDYFMFFDKDRLRPHRYEIPVTENNVKIELVNNQIQFSVGSKILVSSLKNLEQNMSYQASLSIKKFDNRFTRREERMKTQKNRSHSKIKKQDLIILKFLSQIDSEDEELQSEIQSLAAKTNVETGSFIFKSAINPQATKHIQDTDLNIFRETINLKNKKINSNSLFKSIEGINWTDQIKDLNLSKNKLTDVSIIFTMLSSVENLYLDHNEIEQIIIEEDHNSLKKAICSHNKIKKIKGLGHLKSLRKLKLSKNQLEDIEPSLCLYNLKQLDLSSNYFKSMRGIETADFQELEFLNISKMNQKQKYFSLRVPFINLKKLNITGTKLKLLEITTFQLENLEANDCQIEELILMSIQIKYLYLNKNILSSFDEDFFERYKLLQILHIQQSLRMLNCLPILNHMNLEEVNLTNTYFQGAIDPMNQWDLPKLKILKMGFVQKRINVKLPKLSFPNLVIYENPLQQVTEIDGLRQSKLKSLKELRLKGDGQKLQYFPCISMPALESFELKNFLFLGFDEIKEKEDLGNLKHIKFQHVSITQFGQLNLNSLKKITILNSTIKNPSPFQRSQLPNLQVIHLQNINHNLQKQNNALSQKFTKLDFPELRKLVLKKAQIIQNILFNNPNSKLKNLYIQDEIEQICPNFNLPCLLQLIFLSKKVTNLTNLKQSNLENIQKLVVDCPNAEQFRKVNFKNLRKLEIRNTKTPESKLRPLDLKFLQNLEVFNIKLTQFPEMTLLSGLQNLHIDETELTSLEGISSCSLKRLELLVIKNCDKLQNQSLPKMKFPSLKEFRLQNSNICDIELLQNSKLVSLHKLILKDNRQIKTLPFIKFEQLTEFFCYCEKEDGHLEEISNLKTWNTPKIQLINLKGNSIKKIPTIYFPQLKQFNFDSNPVKQIGQYKNSKLPSLQFFSLISNPDLKDLPFIQHCFYEKFQVSESQILKTDKLKKFSARTLILTKDLIKADINLTWFEKTEFLNLSDNHIKNVTMSNDDPPDNLKKLYLQNNLIEEWSPTLKLPVSYLNLNNNLLTNFSICDEKAYQNLTCLQICKNKNLQNIQMLIVLNLEFLILNDNSLQTVNFFQQNVKYKNLNEINLIGNKISTVQFLPEARQWNLDNNSLTNIQWLQICERKKLKILSLDENKIQDIQPLTYLDFENLEQVSLNDNQIKYISPNLFLKKLTKFSINCNYLTEVQINESNFPELKELEVQANQVRHVSINCPKLIKLFLYNNCISKIEPIIAIYLESIDLGENKLTDFGWLQNGFTPNLKQIYCEHNQISKFPNLIDFCHLSKVMLLGNPLSNFQALEMMQKKNDQIQINFSIEVTFENQIQRQNMRLLMKKKYPKSVYENNLSKSQTKKQIQKKQEEKQMTKENKKETATIGQTQEESKREHQGRSQKMEELKAREESEEDEPVTFTVGERLLQDWMK